MKNEEWSNDVIGQKWGKVCADSSLSLLFSEIRIHLTLGIQRALLTWEFYDLLQGIVRKFFLHTPHSKFLQLEIYKMSNCHLWRKCILNCIDFHQTIFELRIKLNSINNILQNLKMNILRHKAHGMAWRDKHWPVKARLTMGLLSSPPAVSGLQGFEWGQGELIK